MEELTKVDNDSNYYINLEVINAINTLSKQIRNNHLETAEYLTNEEMCEHFNIGIDALNQWCYRGYIAYSKPSGKRLFHRDDINKFKAKRRKEAYNG